MKYKIFYLILLIILIPILIPLFILIFLFLYIKIGKPIFFLQKRAGLNGQEFILYKFRTMANLNTQNSYDLKKNYLENEKKRVLESTKFLRKTRLDEIPQLINVLKNEISFVGPRPLLLEYNKLYNTEQAKRLIVKPGITGWSQIKGLKKNTWNERFKLDIWYVENKSIILNFKIIFLTIKFFFEKLLSNHKNEILLNDKFNGKN